MSSSKLVDRSQLLVPSLQFFDEFCSKRESGIWVMKTNDDNDLTPFYDCYFDGKTYGRSEGMGRSCFSYYDFEAIGCKAIVHDTYFACMGMSALWTSIINFDDELEKKLEGAFKPIQDKGIVVESNQRYCGFIHEECDSGPEILCKRGVIHIDPMRVVSETEGAKQSGRAISIEEIAELLEKNL